MQKVFEFPFPPEPSLIRKTNEQKWVEERRKIDNMDYCEGFNAIATSTQVNESSEPDFGCIKDDEVYWKRNDGKYLLLQILIKELTGTK